MFAVRIIHKNIHQCSVVYVRTITVHCDQLNLQYPKVKVVSSPSVTYFIIIFVFYLLYLSSSEYRMWNYSKFFYFTASMILNYFRIGLSFTFVGRCLPCSVLRGSKEQSLKKLLRAQILYVGFDTNSPVIYSIPNMVF